MYLTFKQQFSTRKNISLVSNLGYLKHVDTKFATQIVFYSVQNTLVGNKLTHNNYLKKKFNYWYEYKHKICKQHQYKDLAS